MSEKKLTHVSKDGLPGMVDITGKSDSIRNAVASSRINVGNDVFNFLESTGFHTKKGSILQTAIIAGTIAVKNTFNVIPLSHQIPIHSCDIEINPVEGRFEISCSVSSVGKTGVELEALHGAWVTALTIYDMCKALSPEMVIENVQLEKKTGGKNDFKR
ncbi:MAG: cyclic pyranopterin monophosphate synthase MoaC [Saprospiraceae bacterium]|nr:cyclic pyranopterin monophosphate synthase MoaC [Saprospiraceae bacterium]